MEAENAQVNESSNKNSKSEFSPIEKIVSDTLLCIALVAVSTTPTLVISNYSTKDEIDEDSITIHKKDFSFINSIDISLNRKGKVNVYIICKDPILGKRVEIYVDNIEKEGIDDYYDGKRWYSIIEDAAMFVNDEFNPNSALGAASYISHNGRYYDKANAIALINRLLKEKNPDLTEIEIVDESPGRGTTMGVINVLPQKDIPKVKERYNKELDWYFNKLNSPKYQKYHGNKIIDRLKKLNYIKH